MMMSRGITLSFTMQNNACITEWEGIPFFQVSSLGDMVPRDQKASFNSIRASKKPLRIMHDHVLSAEPYGILFWDGAQFTYFV